MAPGGIQGAIERDELRLFYQPIVSLATGAIAGFEGLLRWQHPERGLLLPSDFMPAADDPSAMEAIIRWELRKACEQARQSQLAGFRQAALISVNLDTMFLKSQRRAEEFVGLALESGLAPCSLAAEVNEPQLLADLGAVFKSLVFLRSFGIQVYLDNFGTALTSVPVLADLPVSRVKVDRAFVARITEIPKAKAVVRALLSAGICLDKEMVAVGVETPEQVDVLQEAGCHFAQGDFFSAPLDVDIAVWMQRVGVAVDTGARFDSSRLRLFNFFQDLPQEQVDDIGRLCNERHIPDGTVLIRQGQVGTEVFLLEEGTVEIYRESRGADTPLALLQAPAVFGEMAVVNPERIRTANVRAVTDLRLVTIPVDALLFSMHRWPELKRKLVQMVAARAGR